jgi:hypothetical protein
MARLGRGYPVRPKIVRRAVPAGPTPVVRVASIVGRVTANAAMRAWLVMGQSPQATKIWDAASGTWLIGAPAYLQTVDAFTDVTLPAGTWTQTSGPAVTLAGLTFTAPPIKGGTTLTFTSGANTAVITVNAWDIFLDGISGLQALRVVQV